MFKASFAMQVGLIESLVRDLLSSLAQIKSNVLSFFAKNM